MLDLSQANLKYQGGNNADPKVAIDVPEGGLFKAQGSDLGPILDPSSSSAVFSVAQDSTLEATSSLTIADTAATAALVTTATGSDPKSELVLSGTLAVEDTLELQKVDKDNGLTLVQTSTFKLKSRNLKAHLRRCP